MEGKVKKSTIADVNEVARANHRTYGKETAEGYKQAMSLEMKKAREKRRREERKMQEEETKMKRVLAGKKSKMNGKLFEDIVSASCDAYREEGVADIEKTPEPMKPVKPLGQGKYVAVFEKKAQADYKGVAKCGRCIVFEAKYTAHEEIRKEAVTEKQMEMLEKYARLKAICFVLVSFDFQKYYRVPWSAWEHMEEIFNHKHIKRREMPEEWEIKMEQGRLLFLTEGEITE